ncbi:hypothetical protein EKN57_22310 [Enterobacter hormaechei]|jgi:hypothetical protein|nr:ogr/Delta-like zinc finger family protein [Enterobacter hormaechei]RTO96198.1 hypothetical protein EKN57_22310 [Enterobacter hormaechei]
MFRCPKCGASTRTRASELLSKTVQRSYHQCNNLMCSTTFCTMTEVSHIVSAGTPNLNGIPPVPLAAFPKSHRGSDQIELAI